MERRECAKELEVSSKAKMQEVIDYMVVGSNDLVLVVKAITTCIRSRMPPWS
jgi:hypothetical protein